MIRILVADDHEVVREGVRTLLEKEPGWKVCGEAGTGREAVALAAKLRPDIVVLDMAMPELNGLEATRQIRRLLPRTEVLIFTGEETEESIHAVFKAGAKSYILKTDIRVQLIAAVKALSEHKSYFTSKISEIVFARYLGGDADAAGGERADQRLTAREREIVQLVAEGKSNKEAGIALGISIKTVEGHRASVMRKLGLANVSDLVRYAIRNKIIEA